MNETYRQAEAQMEQEFESEKKRLCTGAPVEATNPSTPAAAASSASSSHQGAPAPATDTSASNKPLQSRKRPPQPVEDEGEAHIWRRLNDDEPLASDGSETTTVVADQSICSCIAISAPAIGCVRMIDEPRKENLEPVEHTTYKKTV